MALHRKAKNSERQRMIIQLFFPTFRGDWTGCCISDHAGCTSWSEWSVHNMGLQTTSSDHTYAEERTIM